MLNLNEPFLRRLFRPVPLAGLVFLIVVLAIVLSLPAYTLQPLLLVLVLVLALLVAIYMISRPADQLAAQGRKERRQLQKRAAQLELVGLISAQAGTLRDTQQLLDNLCQMVRERFGYSLVTLFLLDRDHANLHMAAGSGERIEELPKPYRQSIQAGIIGWVARNDKPYLARNVRVDPLYLFPLSGETPIRSELAVPLRHGGELFGVLDVESRETNAFDESDSSAMETLADQIATALENARLFAEETRLLDAVSGRLETQRQLVELTRDLLGMIDSTRIIERTAESAARILKADAGLVWLPDSEQGLVVRAAFGWDGTEIRGFRLPADSKSVPGKVVSTQEVSTWTDGDPISSALVHPIPRSSGFRAGISVPMLVGLQAVGVITVNSHEPRRFDDSDTQALSLVANQTAIALERARYFQKVKQSAQEAQTLYEFSAELGATLEIKELGRRALDALGRIADFDIGEVSLVDEQRGSITPIVYGGRGATAEFLSSVFRDTLEGKELRRGVGIVGWVAEHGVPVRLGEVTHDARYLPVSPRIHSEICVPMRLSERVIGVINLEAEARDAFDEHTEQLLTSFANQTAIAIENARLYDQTKRDAQVNSALLRELSHRVKNNLSVVTTMLYLALDEPPEAREKTLLEILGRVQSIALGHGLLARSDSAQVSLMELGTLVLKDTVQQLGLPGDAVELTVDGQNVDIVPRQVTTVALVLNELATNSIRHGLTLDGKPASGKIHLHVGRAPHAAVLLLEDNGRGLPEGFDLGHFTGLGLNLVRTLVEKDLNGSLQVERCGDWTRATVQFEVAAD